MSKSEIIFRCTVYLGECFRCMSNDSCFFHCLKWVYHTFLTHNLSLDTFYRLSEFGFNTYNSFAIQRHNSLHNSSFCNRNCKYIASSFSKSKTERLSLLTEIPRSSIKLRWSYLVEEAFCAMLALPISNDAFRNFSQEWLNDFQLKLKYENTNKDLCPSGSSKWQALKFGPIVLKEIYGSPLKLLAHAVTKRRPFVKTLWNVSTIISDHNS